MPTLMQSAAVAEQPELLSQFKISVKRAAHAIVQGGQPNVPLQAWAKRVLGDAGNPGRSDWYASRMLEGAIFENPAYIDTALAAGPLTSLPDSVVNQTVDTWVTRYAALGI